MATNYSKYIMSTGTHYISNSGSDERGEYHGGTAGDQTGKEWQLRGWYKRPWTCVLRYPDQAVGLKIAALGIDAALNNKIGYDQWNRKSYWTQLVKAGYDPSKIEVACEEDCTAGVTANVKAVGHLLGIKALENIEIDTYSTNMKTRFVKAGFKALTEKKYTNYDTYLLPGDILLYESHHAATNITYGKNVRPATMPPIPGDTVQAGLRRGDEGADVREMQRALLAWDAKCLPKYGADGDFGEETETALKRFQSFAGLPATGVYDAATEKALKSIGKAQSVVATGDVHVRAAPGKESRDLGVLKKGNRLPYQGQSQSINGTPWYLVEYNGQNGWVSSKYAEIVDA